jgi:hypothetical protein
MIFFKNIKKKIHQKNINLIFFQNKHTFKKHLKQKLLLVHSRTGPNYLEMDYFSSVTEEARSTNNQ